MLWKALIGPLIVLFILPVNVIGTKVCECRSKALVKKRFLSSRYAEYSDNDVITSSTPLAKE